MVFSFCNFFFLVKKKLSDEVVTESISTVEERFSHNLLKVSFSNDFVTDFCVCDIFYRFLVARAN